MLKPKGELSVEEPLSSTFLIVLLFTYAIRKMLNIVILMSLLMGTSSETSHNSSSVGSRNEGILGKSVPF